MPIEYLIPTKPLDIEIFIEPIQVLTSQIIKIEKLNEFRDIMLVPKIQKQWKHVLWDHNHYKEKKNSLKNYVLSFPRSKKFHIRKFKKWWFGLYKVWYCLLKNNVLLVTIDKFDPNPILVNMHKLKPYQVSNVGFKGLATQIEERGKDW